MQIEKMLQAIDEATDLLKALAGRQRLLLLCHLSEGEKSVGQLARLIGARDSAVSQQLTLLRKDGLVATRRDGRSIHYSIASRPAARLIETLHELYCEPVGQAADTVVGHDVEMRREQA